MICDVLETCNKEFLQKGYFLIFELFQVAKKSQIVESSLRTCHFEASKDITAKFKSQTLLFPPFGTKAFYLLATLKCREQWNMPGIGFKFILCGKITLTIYYHLEGSKLHLNSFSVAKSYIFQKDYIDLLKKPQIHFQLFKQYQYRMNPYISCVVVIFGKKSNNFFKITVSFCWF